MSKRAFDVDLDEYIAGRRGGGFLRSILSGKSGSSEGQVSLHPEVETYDDRGAPAKEAVSDPAPVAKQGFFSRIFGPKEDDAPIDMSLASPDLHADMKEVARITLRVIKMLPPEQLDSFKRNPDFDRLKEILRKHSLIK